MNPDKKAVALVIYRDDDREEILGVKRPEDDEDHPGMWGMPATSLREGEDWEDAVHRAGREKLGIDASIECMLSEGEQDRDEYVIRLRNYKVNITGGQPDVDQEDIQSTKYVDWKWMPVSEFVETAETGSLCTSLLLESRGENFQMPGNIQRDSIKHNRNEFQAIHVSLEQMMPLEDAECVFSYPGKIASPERREIKRFKALDPNF